MTHTSHRAAATGKLIPQMPDFFIIGAMKSGTTGLHNTLAQHPEIFMAEGEVFFFDQDDLFEHPNFFGGALSSWIDRDFDADWPRWQDWYQQRFQGASSDQRLGEDSTTYLSSELAPARIQRFNPDARIIVMLRDPLERSYSAYWHLLRTGRALFSFEDMLSFYPQLIVQRSLYAEQLRRWQQHFPGGQIKVILFERYVAERDQVLAELCRFLGVASDFTFPQQGLYSNRARIPRSVTLQQWQNRRFWRWHDANNAQNLPGCATPPALSWLQRLLIRLNPMIRGRRPPPMRADTRAFLGAYLKRRNQGLDDMLQLDLARWWKSFAP